MNENMLEFFKRSTRLSDDFQIIHQAGPHNIESIKLAYERLSFESLVFDYIHDLQYCYCAAISSLHELELERSLN